MMVANRRLLLAVGALALTLAIGAAYRGGLLPGTSSTDDAATARRGGRGDDAIVTVSAMRTRLADVPVTIDAVGTVQALNTVTIRTQVDGRLIKLPFTEGQDVQKGDILAEIDPSLYQAQYDQAVAKKAQDEANLANARIDLSRYQRLAVSNFGSQQQYATQKAQVAQLEAQVRADQAAIANTKTTLDFATIHSPIDGRIGIRLVDVGNILRPSDQNGIVVVAQIKPIYVVFTLPQQALPAVQKAQANGPAQAKALGPDNATAIESGQVSVIDNQIDPLTGTVRVKATFDNAQLALWPGQFVNVRLVLDTIKQAVVAPSTAVQRGPNGAFVYVLGDNGVVAMKPVTTGRQDESIAVVTSGLEPGTMVITNGFSRLADGAKVHVATTTTDATTEAAPPRTDGDKGAGDGRRRRERGTRGGEPQTK